MDRLPAEMSLEETSVWSRSSNDSTLLSYPNIKPKATLGDKAFVLAAPKLWNALPTLIKESTSIDTFKRKLKTHLFEKAFLA